ncbi:hypothetical protein K503DRAFT_462117 [Rhizopogon vinicolor AM-OR11-026]|uniref:Rhodopsin domain-containing protein n=1 Tax=Rhizopogon vinicolor AM-OR11-026 TaxID=1314800 RepID=A0A1B7NA50_9AGAM|nr:hypothetical protein K503DRAFT_462117 [Rhizopogon vinicolor AM-OR11-026]
MDDKHALYRLRVSVTVIHTCTIALTSWRLWYKIIQRRWWLEDVWATTALVAVIISEASVWIFSEPPLNSIPGDGPIVAYWLIMISFTIGLWSSRLSILCSIIRLSPPTRIRTVACCTASAFAAIAIALLVQKCWFCARHDDWKTASPLNCPLASSVGVAQVIADFLSDTTLVVLPVHILHQVNLPRDRRILILSVFSGNLLTTLLSIVHAVFFIKADPILRILTGEVEMAFCVIVCDLLPVVTCVHKVLRRKDLEHSQRPVDNHAILLTTVLDMPSSDHPTTQGQKSMP